jgi:hypothetical protein
LKEEPLLQYQHKLGEIPQERQRGARKTKAATRKERKTETTITDQINRQYEK